LQGTDLGQLLRYWAGLRREGAIPRKQDIDPVDMPPSMLPWLMIFQIDEARRGYCRLAGTGICGLLGTDPTGRNLVEMVDAAGYTSWKPAADHAIAAGLPAGVMGSVTTTGREWLPVRALAVPLATDGRVDHLLEMIVRDPVPAPRRGVEILAFTEADLQAQQRDT
jgi:hypothetical protein